MNDFTFFFFALIRDDVVLLTCDCREGIIDKKGKTNSNALKKLPFCNFSSTVLRVAN